MKKIFNVLLNIFIIVLVTLVLIEVGLRLFPGVIPFELLYRFHEEPRAEIARRLNLTTKDDTILVERDDEGPPLRIFKPATNITYNFNDPGIVNTVVMDENGFCNPPENDYNLSTIDIITIGDSFTWCTTVNPQDTWSSQLSILTNIPVYNLGMRGVGLYEYLQILKKFGLQKSPQIVIMNVYEGNDLRDAVIYQSRRGVTMDWVQQQPDLMYYKFINPLERFSYSYNLILAAIDGLRTLGYLEPGPPPPNFRYHLSTEDNKIDFNPQNADLDEVIYARKLVTQEVDVDIFTEALENFVKLSQQHHFTPIVIYTPSAYTVYAKNVIFDDPSLQDVMPRFSRLQREFFKLKAGELDYIFVDMTPALQTAAENNIAPENLLYFQTNLHLTQSGHTVVAETISQMLHDGDFLKR